MIWPLHTFFKLLPILAAAVSLEAGSATGRVELRDSQDAAVRKRMDFSGVVVWLDPLNGSLAPPPPVEAAKMSQKDKTFTPHVLAIRAGSSVDFPNFDPIFHNAFSNYNGRTFDVGLYPPGTSRRVSFSRPGVVRVFCNIHATMSAVIVVLSTPYFETTQKNGSFQFNNIAPGEYSLKFFHERATQATLDSLTRRITIGDGNTTLPGIGISESGYIVIPHHNKYGHEYTDPPDDGGVYPAVRK